eukprot:4392348-Pyramimonas_sp.AAC.2
MSGVSRSKRGSAWRPITGESSVGIYLCGDQSQGSHRVYTCVGANHAASCACGTRASEKLVGIEVTSPRDDDTCVETNHRGASGYIPAWGQIAGEPAGAGRHGGTRAARGCARDERRPHRPAGRAEPPIIEETSGIYSHGAQSKGSQGDMSGDLTALHAGRAK